MIMKDEVNVNVIVNVIVIVIVMVLNVLTINDTSKLQTIKPASHDIPDMFSLFSDISICA